MFSFKFPFNRDIPETVILAPLFFTNLIFSLVIPPSTSIFLFGYNLLKRLILSKVSNFNSCPPNPGLTVIIKTSWTSSI